MGVTRNHKRLIAAVITVAGLSAGVMATHADQYRNRAYENSAAVVQDLAVTPAGPAAGWPTVPSTCTSTPCNVGLQAGAAQMAVGDTTATGGNVTDMNFWGFSVKDGATFPPAGLAGSPQSTIKVPEGTDVTITFSQSGVGQPIELSFPSLKVDHTAGSDTYVVHTTGRPGTHVYQPGTNNEAPRQVAMGLAGVFIVTPATCSSCAYDAAAPFADEAVVALTDLDYEFAKDPLGYDMSYFGQPRDAQQNQRKVYHAINGKVFPETDVIDVRNGDNLLLRYVNAGVKDKNMGLLGLRQTVLATNASQHDAPLSLVAPLVGPGETADVAVAIPADAVAGQKYSLMDQSREMNHGSAEGFGGALTFIDVWSAGPTVSDVAFDVDTRTLTATGTPSSASRTITGFQTLVTSTSMPPADWSTAVLQPLAGVLGQPAAISVNLPSALAGEYVWVRVQQDAPGWSLPGSVLVGSVAPKVSAVAYDGATLTATGTSDPSLTITGYQTVVNGGVAPADGDWSATVPVTPNASVSISTPLVAAPGQTIWVRVQDSDVVPAWSAAGSFLVPTPVVDPLLTVFTAPDQLTISGSSTVAVLGAEWSVGAVAPAGGAGNPVVPVSSSFGAATYTDTITLTAPPASALPVTGDSIWVRVQDQYGWSAPFEIVVTLP